MMEDFSKNMLFWTFDLQKTKLDLKIENLALSLRVEFNADSKTVFVFLLALVVSDIYSFEGSAIFIIIILLFIIIIVMRNYMNASYHGIICACMIFQPLCSFIYTLFCYEIGFSTHLMIMTSPNYYDVTHF